jgi:cytochrome c-type biogenesis protein CcmH
MSSLCAVLVGLSLGLGPAAPLFADGAAPTHGPVVETDLDEAHAIGKLLRCPVCQGMPIAESPSQMAQDMMARVREMQRAGKSRAAILDYFVERYGEWVLLEPRAHGMNLGLWILPAGALIMGALLVVRYARRRGTAAAPSAAAMTTVDPTLRAIRDEVNE